MRFESSINFLVHGLNAIWIGRFAFLFAAHRGDDYLRDPILLGSLATTITVHILRWMIISSTSSERTYRSCAELANDMRKTADRFFGVAPYLVKPLPTDILFMRRAEALLMDSGSFAVRRESDLAKGFLSIPGLSLVHFLCVVFVLAMIVNGRVPASLGMIDQLWILYLPIVVLVLGLFVYSCAVLLYSLFL
jgi:hypothetical protein